jgi:hypothetical protein
MASSHSLGGACRPVRRADVRARRTSPGVDEPKSIRLIEDRWTVIRHAVEAIAIVAAGIWAFYVFIYQERIKPALEPPSLEVNINFDRGTIVRGVRVAELNVIMHNTGRSDLELVGTIFTAYGERFEPKAKPSPPASPGPNEQQDDRSVPTTAAELIWTFGQLRAPAEGARPTRRFILRSEQQETFTLPVSVIEGRYDLLSADVQIAYTKADSRTRYLPVKLAKAKDGSLVLDMPARDGGAYPDLIRAERSSSVALSAPQEKQP